MGLKDNKVEQSYYKSFSGISLDVGQGYGELCNYQFDWSGNWRKSYPCNKRFLHFYIFDFEQGNLPIVIDEADNPEVNSKQNQLVNVTCLPLYSILMALDNPSIGLYLLFLVKIFV